MSDETDWTRPTRSSGPTLTWPQVRDRMMGLWPEWEATPEILREWDATLGALNPAWVDRAISGVYRTRPGKEPRLAHVLQEFGAISREWNERQGHRLPTGESSERAAERCRQDHEQRLAWIERQPKERVQAAVDAVRSSRWGAQAKVSIRSAGEPRTWSRMAIALVWAEMQGVHATGRAGR